jgi:hypothetical protein
LLTIGEVDKRLLLTLQGQGHRERREGFFKLALGYVKVCTNVPELKLVQVVSIALYELFKRCDSREV